MVISYRKIAVLFFKSLVLFTAAFIALSVVLVIVFRWAPISTSGVMIEREIEAYLDGKLQTKMQTWVEFDTISPAAPLAVIASEDQRFFQHYGFDFDQIEKALEESRHGKRLRGASTISQQTAKNLFLWSGRNYLRKGLEVWFTFLIELLWPKERILEVYLNIVEFGSGVYGVEAASQRFFNKPAARLSHYEAALLAAVLPNPHRMHVARPSEYVRERQVWIVEQMMQLVSVEMLRSLP